MSETSGTPNITETETPDLSSQLGVDDGDIVVTEVAVKAGAPLKQIEERVVFDYEVDEDGNSVLDRDGNPIQVGWHKVSVE